jgi:hypothetical protein
LGAFHARGLFWQLQTRNRNIAAKIPAGVAYFPCARHKTTAFGRPVFSFAEFF